VEQEIGGSRAHITERNLALFVYERGPDFDPKLDGTVRAEAIRLRNKLREYYEGVTGKSPRIEIPKGRYFPLLIGFEPEKAPIPELPLSSEPGTERNSVPRIAVAAMLAVTLILLPAFGGWFNRFESRPSPAGIARAAHLLEHAQALLKVGESPAARQALEYALALNPGSAEAHLAYSEALQNPGYDERTREEALLARHLAVSSGNAPELAFEARLRASESDWPAAIRAYRFLWERSPDVFAFAQGLAETLTWGHDFSGCLETVGRARQLPEGAANPELDRLEGLCRASMDDNARALVAVQRGADRAKAAGLRGALSRLILLEAGILQNTGQNSVPFLDRARSLCADLHDDFCLARVNRVRANLMVAGGRYQDALRLYDEALPIAQRLANKKELANLVDGAGTALLQMGHLQEAEGLFARVFSGGAATRDSHGIVGIRAALAYARGDLNEAEVLMDEVLDRYDLQQIPGTEANARLFLAAIATERADLPRARSLVQSADELIRRYQIPEIPARWHTAKAVIESLAGNRDRAFAELGAAQAEWQKEAIAEFDLRMTALRIHLRQSDDAYLSEHAATEAAEMEKRKRFGDAAEARALLAESLFRNGHAAEAREALTLAQTVPAESPLPTRLAVMCAAILGSADRAEADRLSAEASRLASRSGFRTELFEVRMIREERRLRDDPPEARRQLDNLRQETGRLGLRNFLDRANSLLSRAQARTAGPREKCGNECGN
jgi:tetratricopeptide (TPR) repeat protein